MTSPPDLYGVERRTVSLSSWSLGGEPADSEIRGVEDEYRRRQARAEVAYRARQRTIELFKLGRSQG